MLPRRGWRVEMDRAPHCAHGRIAHNGAMRFARLVLLLLAAPAFAAPNLSAGRKVAEKCGNCHALGPTGDSPLPPAPPFRDLSRRYPVENLQEALAEGIVVGHNAPMPEFRLTGEEIENFLAWLGSIQTYKRP